MRALVTGILLTLTSAPRMLGAQSSGAGSGTGGEKSRAVDSVTLAARVAELEARLRALEERRRHDSAAGPVVSAGAQGFFIRSADGEFQVRLRGYYQGDGRFLFHDVDQPVNATFLVRRVRPVLEATVWGRMDFRLMPDWGDGRTTLFDAYGDIRLTPAFNIRSGKFRPPIGLERLQSVLDLAFTEYAAPSYLVPIRDIGLQVYGELAGGRLTYAVGVFNGVPDFGNVDSDVDDDKDLAGRIFVQPFRTSAVVALQELGIGVAGSRGQHHGSVAVPFLQAYRSPAQQAVFAFRSDGSALGTTIAAGLHERLTPQGYWYAGPAGLLWEYTRTTQVVQRGASAAELAHHAWHATTSVVLTGEKASFRGVTPAHPFDPAAHHWGAVELAGRYAQFAVDSDAFPVFANPAQHVRTASTWGAAVNWYLARGIRLQVDYLDTHFARGGALGDREREHALMTRIQHSF